MGKFKDIVNNKEKLNKACQVAFDKFDADKSNYIDQKELKGALTDFSKMLDLTADINNDVKDKFFDELDTNKDGKISFLEFSVLIKRYFELKAANEP